MDFSKIDGEGDPSLAKWGRRPRPLDRCRIREVYARVFLSSARTLRGWLD